MPNTANTIQKAIDATHIGDSRITDNGTVIQAGTNTDNVQVQSGYVQLYSQGGEAYIGGDTTSIDIDDGGGAMSITAPADGQINITIGAGGSIALGSTTTKLSLFDTSNAIAQPAPAATTAGILTNGQISFWIDEMGNALKVAVQYSDGTTKTGSIALT